MNFTKKINHSMLLFCSILLFSYPATLVIGATNDGLITVQSPYAFSKTISMFKKQMYTHKLKIYKKINHTQNAKDIGIKMQPTLTVIFGNSRLNTELIQCNHLAAIDLPLKILIHENKDKQVFLSYISTSYLQRKYEISGCEDTLTELHNLLSEISKLR